MMDHPVIFDTHAFVKNMIAAGMSEAVAEALVKEQQKWNNTNLTNLVTKQDLESFRQEIKHDFTLLQRDIAQGQKNLLMWIISMFIMLNGLMLAMVKFL